MSLAVKIILVILFVVVGPFLGALLSGIDRKISARMQKRVGPPIIQPIYDVAKLFGKVPKQVNVTERIFVICYLVCIVVAGVIFFAGGDFLMVVFVIAMGSLFFVLAGYSTRSPYADEGAMREIIQSASYEPMLLIIAVGLYMVTGSFAVESIWGAELPVICQMPLIFIGLVYILTIKFRKSPFDISTSHHAHQELVKGITTEMAGPTFALVEMTHWYENVLFLAWVGMFLVWGNPVSIVLAIVVAVVAYVLETLIDNNFARVKYQSMLKWTWWISLIIGIVNLVGLAVLGIVG